MTGVAALFVRARSVYSDLADCWDEQRDARRFPFDRPVVAHPPCRGWGKLRHMAKASPGELELAFFALRAVRRCGGVLEHPWTSGFWSAAGISKTGERDGWGGLLVPVRQSAWGHRAEKWTGLYFVRCGPLVEPVFVEPASHLVEYMGRAERERTPADLARALVACAAGARQ